jgi:hypothetical protein
MQIARSRPIPSPLAVLLSHSMRSQDTLSRLIADMLPNPSRRILKRHVQNQSIIDLLKQASSSQQHAQSGRHATRTWHDSHAATQMRQQERFSVPATRPNRFSAPKQGSWPPEGGVCGLIDERGSQRVADEGRVCTTLHARCCMLFGALRCVALACPISGGWASLPSHRRPATRCGASETLTGFANIVRFFIRCMPAAAYRRHTSNAQHHLPWFPGRDCTYLQ